MKLGLTPLLSAAVLVLPALAHAQAPEPAEPPVEPAAPAPAPPPAPPPAPAQFTYRAPPPLVPAESAESATPHVETPPRYDYLRFGLGFRIGYIPDPTFDAFADSDVLAQMSLDASYAFYTKGKLAIAAGLAWDVGSRTTGARGLTTKLTMHRLTVPIEARWYFAPWFDVFAKVAPGTGALYARVEDPSSPKTLEHAPWVFATDLSAGASFRLVGGSDHDKRRPRLWITHEIGYGLTTEHALQPRPSRDDADVLGSDQSTNLGSLAVNGVFWRTGLALTF
jgi:hypothetical protein